MVSETLGGGGVMSRLLFLLQGTDPVLEVVHGAISGSRKAGPHPGSYEGEDKMLEIVVYKCSDIHNGGTDS